MQREERIHVVGAGVSGLSCALRLIEAGHSVRVIAAEPPGRTTSAVAAALWLPYESRPAGRVAGWCRASYDRFTRLFEEGVPGIAIVEALVLARGGGPLPEWAASVPDFRLASPEELPPGHAHGFRMRLFVIEMPPYLAWLEAEVRARAAFEERRLASLDEALAGARGVVDCAGLGARELVPDPRCYPLRGQIVRVRCPAVRSAFVDDEHPGGPTYVVPRSGDVVLGGTAERGRTDLEPDPDATAEILGRCIELVPALARARLQSEGVGLRPARDEVRLELETRADGRWIAHDYGHGGAGVTLSWGCAEEVLELVRRAEGGDA